MGNRKRSQLKKSTSKEFTKFVAQSSGGNQGYGKPTPPQSRETAFTWKLVLLRFLWTFRLLVVLLPQTGYIQPDEFFQFTEPVAGDVLGVENMRAWEFNQTSPLRSMFFPALFTLPALQYLKMFHFASDLGNASTYILLVGPRILITLASFGIDFSVYRLCRVLYATGPTGPTLKSSLSHKALDCLLAHATCYLAYSYYTHTFSNTIEAILFGLLLVTVVESLRQTDSNGLTYFNISILLAVGFFNRPTFAVFAFVPMIYWLVNYATSNHSKAFSKSSRSSKGQWTLSLLQNAGKNGLKLAVPFTVTATLLVLLDTAYHRGLDDLSTAISELSVGKIVEYLVLTPRNFLHYNLQTKNLLNHGLHPAWFHALVCMPWLFTILAFIFYLDIAVKIKSLYPFNIRNVISCNATISVLNLSIIFSLASFSLMPHQEPRFILPLVIPIFCLLGHRIFTFPFITLLWFGINFNLMLFYGHIHQAGVVPALTHLRSNVVLPSLASAQPTTLIFARQYLPPRHLLAIPKEEANLISIHDLSILDFPSAFLEDLAQLTPSTSDNSTSTSIYLTLPGCLTGRLKASLGDYFPNVTVRLQYQHFPHFSAEDLGDSVRTLFEGHHDSASNDTSVASWWAPVWRLHDSFCMNIWKLSYNEPE